MPLKSFQNPAEKDNLLSYFGTDRVMQAQLKKMSDAQPEPKAAPAPVMRQIPNGRMVTEARYKEWRRRGGRWPGE